MSNIAKISVEKFDGKDQFLYDFDKSIGLCENVRIICKKIGLPESPVYGLKLLPTKENPFANGYISEKNIHEIKHNDCLKVVFSVKYLTDRMKEIEKETMRPICFEDLHKLSVDPVFIEELVDSGINRKLIDLYITDQNLKTDEQLALLITIVHLFQKGHIADTSQNILEKTIEVLRCGDTTSDESKYALSILHKILCAKNSAFNTWKEKIIKSVPVTELTPYIWSEEDTGLQYGVLLLINTIIKLCKGEKKQQLIKEMNLRKNRENIYKNIILAEKEMDKNMEHELYVTQTYLLGLFKEALNNDINLNDNSLFKREEFELCSNDMRRITILMDFDEANDQTNKNMSVENLVAYNGNDQRLSLNSALSEESTTDSRKSSIISRKASECFVDFDNLSISYLTLEALRHYKKFHYKNFYQSQIEEQVYEPGIFVTSERVVKMLAKILHVGVDPPDNKSTFYQPIVFYCSPRTPFFLELFSRSMWLLSKTRREMKASTITDYPKVMNILEKQVKMVLETKPRDFKALTDRMSCLSFEKVLNELQKEKEEELKILIENHPCIQEIKERFRKQNEDNVFKQRIHCLLQGAHFPKVFEKKTSGNMFVQLSKNQRDLMVFDVTDIKTNKMNFQEKFKIADITHVVIGKNCKHSNLCHSPTQAFSLVIDHEEKLKFISKDERTASYWTDALNLLTGNNRRSKFYQSELDTLVEMDVRLQLLELQNITIPKNPPIVPPPPIETRPTVPPKPQGLSMRLLSRKMHP